MHQNESDLKVNWYKIWEENICNLESVEKLSNMTPNVSSMKEKNGLIMLLVYMVDLGVKIYILNFHTLPSLPLVIMSNDYQYIEIPLCIYLYVVVFKST